MSAPTSRPQPATPSDPTEAAIAAAVDESLPGTLESLAHLVSIPGIAWASFDPENLQRSARTVADLFSGLGLEAQVLSVDAGDRAGGPAVVATRPAAEGQPTVLLYAHHDVQPPGDPDAWESEPFTLVERGGRLFGRGAADDKGGVMVHVAALGALAKAVGETGVGVTVFVEGEEEAGSPTFRAFLDAHRDLLRADVIVVADAGNWKAGVPALTTSLRGLVDGTVTVKVLDHGVHSGMFGGPVLDAVTLLSRLIATLHDENGDVAVEGLVQGTAEGLDYDEDAFRADASMLPGTQLAGTGSLTTRLWNRPALSVIGLDAPAVDVASNTITPAARAKLSLRLAPGQDPTAAMEALERHLTGHAPFGAQVEFTVGESGQAFDADVTSTASELALRSLSDAWGTPAVTAGMGGSIPFVADLTEVYPEAQILLTGVIDPDTRAHGADESMDRADFRNAIVAEALLLHRLRR
ncbi:dipeptidase [Tersicoccus sp. Bi-70]|uniref:dipeptidase n=1 Tax=Tersicoccus sp. Bi-70 TaxID=1897634 RepID=UPI0009782E77|nr:dipeptidase [Tersicoccus sp. Bi-70]OMH37067.1 dipeptidase [Tersicoccus sp. Bi-70]